MHVPVLLGEGAQQKKRHACHRKALRLVSQPTPFTMRTFAKIGSANPDHPDRQHRQRQGGCFFLPKAWRRALPRGDLAPSKCAAWSHVHRAVRSAKYTRSLKASGERHALGPLFTKRSLAWPLINSLCKIVWPFSCFCLAAAPKDIGEEARTTPCMENPGAGGHSGTKAASETALLWLGQSLSRCVQSEEQLRTLAAGNGRGRSSAQQDKTSQAVLLHCPPHHSRVRGRCKRLSFGSAACG